MADTEKQWNGICPYCGENDVLRFKDAIDELGKHCYRCKNGHYFIRRD